MKLQSFLCAACCAAVVAVPLAQAQDFPVKPMKMIVPFAPGGTNDIIGRLLGAKLAESFGQQVVIDNRGGAGGSIGMELAAKSPPDGYTMVIGHIGTLAVNPTLYRNLPYNPLTDFQAITLVAMVPNILVVHPSVPAKNVRELVALAKAKPGSLAYGSGGAGGAAHLAMEYFRQLAKIELIHVPYKGTGLALVDLVAGQTSLVFAGIPGISGYVREGRLRALGVSTTKRLAAFPELPTVAEAGVPGYDATQWYGMLAPAGIPKPVLVKLHGGFIAALQTPIVKERLAADGAEPVGNSPEEFQAFIKGEIQRWAPVVKAIGPAGG